MTRIVKMYEVAAETSSDNSLKIKPFICYNIDFTRKMKISLLESSLLNGWLLNVSFFNTLHQ